MSEFKYFLDTNIFLRLIIRDNAAMAADCVALVDAIEAGIVRAVTSNLVLAEAVWTLGRFYAMPRVEIAQALRSILYIKNLAINGSLDGLIGADLYAKSTAKFVDCLIASHPKIQQGRMAVVSYDRDFDKLGVTRLEPKQVLVRL